MEHPEHIFYIKHSGEGFWLRKLCSFFMQLIQKDFISAVFNSILCTGAFRLFSFQFQQ
jgi:hypothetical protein